MKRLGKSLFCAACVMIAAVMLFFGLTACSADPNRYLVLNQPRIPFSDQRETVSVISYNIQARPLLDDCAWKNPQIGERLRPFDLIGLQESFCGYRQLFEQNSLHSKGAPSRPAAAQPDGGAIRFVFPSLPHPSSGGLSSKPLGTSPGGVHGRGRSIRPLR